MINKDLIKEINDVFETFVSLQSRWANKNSTAAHLTKIYFSRLPIKGVSRKVRFKKSRITT